MKKYSMLGRCVFSGSNIILVLNQKQTNIVSTKEDQTMLLTVKTSDKNFFWFI